MRFRYAVFLGLASIILVGGGCATNRPESITWDVLPFPRDSDWPAWNGVAANLKDGELVLQGHPVRTRKAYSLPITIECKVVLEARVATDGYFGVGIVPVGSPPDVDPRNLRWLQIACRGPASESSRDGLSLLGRDDTGKDKLLWGEKPFPITAGKPFSIQLEVTAGRVHLVIDDRTYDIDGIEIPYKQFYIQLVSWQPADRWHVQNFSVH
jgi:hypothetical protein